MKKRIVSLLLVISMVATLSAQAFFTNANGENGATQNPFSDVPNDAWYYENVMYALANNLFQGTSDTQFSPDGTMTRAMYVTVMGRIAEIKPQEYANRAYFNDVAADSWYAPFVAWAKGKGITGGVGEGKFDPDRPVTREEMAALTVRFFDAYGIRYPESTITTKPKDLNQIANYAQTAVLKLWACGLLQGDSAGNFNPRNNAKRCEAAAFCGRVDKTVEQWFVETGVKEDPNKDKEKEDIEVTAPSGSGYQVTFVDGSRTIEQTTVRKGSTLGQVPSTDKTAKEGYIHVGWYQDAAFTTPFYADDPIRQNMTVYAKYEEVQKAEITPSSFAQVNQAPDLSFEVIKVQSTAPAITDALKLTPMDGSDPLPLAISEQNGVYTVRADGGFREGSSYELTLAEGYDFKDKPASIRTASFTIAKEEVANLAFNEDIVYVQDTDDISYTINGETHAVLKAGLLANEQNEALTGSFSYTGDRTGITEDTILCVYQTTHPNSRDYINGDYTDDAIAYVKVVGVSGNTIYFTGLGADDAKDLYFLPDTFPLIVAGLPTGDTGTVNFSALDTAVFATMGKDKTKAEDTEVNVGDFVVLYVNAEAIQEEADVYYGKVTDYNPSTKEITYERTTLAAIEQSMEMFLNEGVDGDSLLETVDREQLKEDVLKQVKESGFAEDAAFYLAGMASKTNGFKNLDNVQVMLSDENGNRLSDEEIELLGIGGTFELSDDIGITVELETDKKKLHLGDGVRLAVGIDAEFSVDVNEEGDSIKIDLNATFVEELAVGIDVQADAKWKKFLWVIPVLKGLRIDSAIDLKNYSAVSMNVKVYSVAPEDEEPDGMWTKFKGISENKAWKKTFETIEEIESKINQAKGTYEQIQGYKDQLKAAWDSIPEDVTNPEEWKQMAQELGQLDVTKELMDMMHLTSETELDAGVADLMQQYSEMLQNESDWVKLFDKEILFHEKVVYGVAIRISASFVIRGNINLALGTNMEYEVGKRYAFWIDVFKLKSGSSKMDLLDERFAFQFYIMGALGLKMGVAAEMAVGFASTKIGSVGLSAEVGPYVKLYGFFIFEYSQLRPANTKTWIYDEQMAGAMYVDFGLYMIVSVEAQALNKILEYSKDLVDEEVPILTVGKSRYHYDFAYDVAKDETLQIKDEDSNSNNGVTMTLPESYRAMSYVDLDDGELGEKSYDYNKYNITLSNRNFAIDKKGQIRVTVPPNVQYMTCDLTITWKQNKLTFDDRDIAVTIPLVWTNLTNSELNEYFTASVRAGNAQDGYRTVWSRRVKKNQPFALPSEEEVKKLIGYSDYLTDSGTNLKYASVTGYGATPTEDLTIYSDTAYDFGLELCEYNLNVQNVERADGTKETKTFTAKFGEAFDLSSLASTGTDRANADPNQAAYTKFLRLEYVQDDLTDLKDPIGAGLATKLQSGANQAQAVYADDSVLVKFHFEGIKAPDQAMRVRKGTVPAFDYSAVATAAQATVTDITPILSAVSVNTDYTISCTVNEGAVFSYQINFESNGGSEIKSATYPENSVITAPKAPTKTGYTFAGWYSDAKLSNVFDWSAKMPSHDITLYAKWTANEYSVTLNGNGGAFEGGANTATAKVTYGEAYGSLPQPTQQGKVFAGWLTDLTDGESVYSGTKVTKASNHELYARWDDRIVIDPTTITYIGLDDPVYSGQAKSAKITTGSLSADLFTIEYKRNDAAEWSDRAINAGLYSVKVSVKNNAQYAPFEKTFPDVMIIAKAPSRFTLNFVTDPNASDMKKANQLVGTALGNNFVITPLVKGVDYVGDGQIEYCLIKRNLVSYASDWKWQTSNVFKNPSVASTDGINTDDQFILSARIKESENYLANELTVWKAAQKWWQADTYYVDAVKIPPAQKYCLNAGNGYTYKIKIKTSDIKNAGTNAKIYASFGGLYGYASSNEKFRLDNPKIDDFERGKTSTFDLYCHTDDPAINPMGPTNFVLDYVKDGTAAGWHCEWIEIELWKNGTYLATSERIAVNRWFENSTDSVSGKFSFQRAITGVGNFGEIAKTLTLDYQSTGNYDFTYDGLVSDQYRSNYNSFFSEGSPALMLTAKGYEDCFTSTINTVSIDKAKLYAKMKANGVKKLNIIATLTFDDALTSDQTKVWTETIAVTFDMS